MGAHQIQICVGGRAICVGGRVTLPPDHTKRRNLKYRSKTVACVDGGVAAPPTTSLTWDGPGKEVKGKDPAPTLSYRLRRRVARGHERARARTYMRADNF